jgi:hypothetical protein
VGRERPGARNFELRISDCEVLFGPRELNHTSFFALGASANTNEKSLSTFMGIGFRRLQRGSFVSRIFARATKNQKTAWSEVPAARNKGTIRFGQ